MHKELHKQCCQVNFPKNPNIALKKSQDSLFFPEKSQDSHFYLLTSFQVPLIAWSDHALSKSAI